MSATAAIRPIRGVDDLRLVGRQIRYEQISFWLNPISAIFTIGFSVVFMILLEASAGSSRSSNLANLKLIQYYAGGFIAYGVMSTCFNQLAISLVVRREMGLLKRLRLSPLPTWALFAAILGNAVIITAIQVVALLLIGRIGYHVVLPHNWAAFVVALVVGVVAFTAIGIAMSTVIPNQEAAGPLVSIVFFILLFLSGLWYPIAAKSGLAQIASVFPVRHMILAMLAPFDPRKSGWAGNDLLIMAIWGVGALLVASRRWAWAPRAAQGSGLTRRRLGLFR